MAAATAPRKTPMKVMMAVGAILPLRVEAPAVIPEGGAELRLRTGNTMTDHCEARLAAAMEGEQEDLLELVEATVDGEEAPGEVTKASV